MVGGWLMRREWRGGTPRTSHASPHFISAFHPVSFPLFLRPASLFPLLSSLLFNSVLSGKVSVFFSFLFSFFFFLSFLFSLNFVTSFVQGGPFAAWHRGAFVCVPLFSFPPLSRKIFVSVQITEVSIRRRFMRNYTLYQHDKRDIEILGR